MDENITYIRSDKITVEGVFDRIYQSLDSDIRMNKLKFFFQEETNRKNILITLQYLIGDAAPKLAALKHIPMDLDEKSGAISVSKLAIAITLYIYAKQGNIPLALMEESLVKTNPGIKATHTQMLILIMREFHGGVLCYKTLPQCLV